MTDEFREAHDELRVVARELLGASAGPETPDAAAHWRLFADSGWLGLDAPETCDGAGATFAEVAVLLEELGRAATTSAYLGTAVLGAGLLDALEPSEARDDLWRRVASGDLVLAAAVGDGDSDTWPPEVPFRIHRSEDGVRVDGVARFVPDAADAAQLLLLALDDSGDSVVVHLPADHPGLRVTATTLVDATRNVATVVADSAAVLPGWVMRFSAGSAGAASGVLDRAAVALACDSLGLSRAMLDATVEYAGVRSQFGRPIGSFQAVKHACADMLVRVAVSEQLVTSAVRAIVDGDPDAWAAASRAKSYACAAAVDVVGKAMQLHGGIGYTWESGVHVFLKRATLNRSLFGSPRAHRRRLATSLVVAQRGQ